MVSCFILILSSVGCKPEKTAVEFKMEVFQIANSGWGYKIFKQDKTFIVQYNIPAIPEKKTFHSHHDAERVGSLMIHKLKQNKMPSIKVSELDSLKIIYK